MAYVSKFDRKGETWERDVPINQRHVGAKSRKLADINDSQTTLFSVI